MIVALLVAGALVGGARAAPSQEVELVECPYGVSVPPGRVAELLESLPAELAALELPAPWPAWDERSASGWGGELAWRRWVELLRAERAGASGSAERRAELARLARLQGRDGDAWEHLLAVASEPARVAALLPLFVPGVPEAALGAMRLPEGSLPDGVLLAPALPPCDDPSFGLRCLAGTRLEARDFALGAARCALKLSVERDGLEVALRHLSGGPARVRVRPPLPRGVDAGLLFADWERQEGHAPVEFTLSAEAPEHSLWLTFHPPSARWPKPRLETLAPEVAQREVVVLSPYGDEPHFARFAEALGELLGVPSALARAGSRPRGVLAPIALHLSDELDAERKWLDVLGLAEAFALRAPVR
jgi:hypothetical protein